METLNNSVNQTEVKVAGLDAGYLLKMLLTGFLAAIIWLIFKLLLSDKLQNIQELPGVHLLGILYAEKTKNIIDKKILKYKAKSRVKITLNAQIELAAVKTILLSKRLGITEIYVTGSNYEHRPTEIVKPLIEKLKEGGLRIEEGTNFCYNAVALKKAVEAGSILLIEQTGDSQYSEILKEQEISKEQQITVLGMVVLESL